MRRFALMLAFFLVLLIDGPGRTEDPAAEDANKADLQKLQGTWTTTSATRGRKSVPDEDAKKIKLVIKGNKYTLDEGKEPIEGTFKIDATKKPKQLDAVRTEGPNKGKTIKAIYKLDGDTFELHLGPAGGERPKDFDKSKVAETRTYVHKRATP